MTEHIFKNSACNLINALNYKELRDARKVLLTGVDVDSLTFQLHITYKKGNVFFAKTCFFSLSNKKVVFINPKVNHEYDFIDAKMSDVFDYYNLSKNDGYDIFYAILICIFNNMDESLKYIDVYSSAFNDKLRKMQQKNISGTGGSIGNSDVSTKDESFKNAFLIINKYKKTISDINHLLVKEKAGFSKHNKAIYDKIMSRVLVFEKKINLLIERFSFSESVFRNLLEINDVSVIKIFTIMWTLYIPGTAIVNWYGQNFTRMPELSLNASWWVQVGALFILTIIPLVLIKNKGMLR